MKVHFIAVGGSVMHQLAISLKLKGYEITGSDDDIFEPAKTNLTNAGIMPSTIGWNIKNINKDLDAVILGMHARLDNPELICARELGLKIYSFPEYIYSESLNKKRVAIGGSHGKTTTTSMIMYALQKTGKDFDFMVGAKLEGFDQSVQISQAPVIICEADEYPASAIERRPKFHFLFPHLAVLTGIAWDHINVFPTFEFYKEQFIIFIGMIEKGGLLIYNETDPVLKELVENNKRDDINYKPYHLPENSISNGETTVSIEGAKGVLSVFGDHNLMNLNAAYLVCKDLGVSAKDFLNVIVDFKGAARRLEVMFKEPWFNIYRDFAHAPSKVKASIQAVKNQFPDRKLITILELHTYSSLNADFMTEYKGSMDLTDHCAVFYSAHALEIKRMPFLEPEIIRKGFAKENLAVLTDKNMLKDWLQKQEFNESNLLLMSSGSFEGLDILATINKGVQ